MRVVGRGAEGGFFHRRHLGAFVSWCRFEFIRRKAPEVGDKGFVGQIVRSWFEGAAEADTGGRIACLWACQRLRVSFT